MGGRAALILVMGFGAIFGYIALHLNELESLTIDNTSKYFEITSSHNLAAAGANVGLAKLYQDSTLWNCSTDTTLAKQSFTSGNFKAGSFTVRFGPTGVANKVRLMSTSALISGTRTYRDTAIIEFDKLSQYDILGLMIGFSGNDDTWITRDTMWGRVQFNGRVSVKGSPVYNDKISVSKGFDPPPGTSVNQAIFMNGYETGVNTVPLPAGSDTQDTFPYRDITLSGNYSLDLRDTLTGNDDGFVRIRSGLHTYTGSGWSPLGSGMTYSTSPRVMALAAMGTDLYAGGIFTTAGGVGANFVAKWNGTTWSNIGGGDTYVRCFANHGSDLYVGGDFLTVAGVSVNKIAKWNGTTWSALGSGLTAPVGSGVGALAVIGTNLYAGGDITTAGGASVNKIAKWDLATQTWSALGNGTNGWVAALEVIGTDLYVGGSFQAAGSGANKNFIAKWNETAQTWSALGSPPGMNNNVRALDVIGTNLYAGGDFTTAGGVTVNYISQWNETAQTWSALGSGMNGSVYSLFAAGTDLYAGGNFTTAGGVTVNGIAKWNGTTWSALGSGVNIRPVYAFFSVGSDLYAGGEFTTIDGVSAKCIAKLDAPYFYNIPSSKNGVILVRGDVSLKGVVDGHLTIASTGKIYVDDDVTYAVNPQVTPASDDILGLVAIDDIVVYRPSTSSKTEYNIQSVIASLTGSFVADYPNTFVGGVIRNYGGILAPGRTGIAQYSGSGSGSNPYMTKGFYRRFRWDSRLAPPPRGTGPAPNGLRPSGFPIPDNVPAKLQIVNWWENVRIPEY